MRINWTAKRLTKMALMALWLSAALLIAACGQEGQTDSPAQAAHRQEVDPLPAAATLPAASATAAQAATPLPAPVVAATATSLPTPSPTAIPLQGDPCGLLLPLLPLAGATPVAGLGGTGDASMVPAQARAAVQFILDNPGSVALVAYRLGAEEQGIYVNADVSVPLASTVKLAHLVAYANAVEAGELDPAGWVDVAELEKFYLPNSDLRSHETALADAAERGLLVDNRVPLEEIVWMMVRHSSNTATDYLGGRLGQATLEATALELGLVSSSAPCPWLGQFLAMANHTRIGTDEAALEAYLADPELYGSDVIRLVEAYTADPAFRAAEAAWRPAERRPNMITQRAYSAALGPMGTAREMAAAMELVATNAIGSDYVNILVRRALEWPMIFPVNQERFWTVGYKGGSLPGILTGIYYGEPLADRTPVIVTIFFRDLPNYTYRSWRRDWPHDELALWLMYDPAAIPTLRQILQ